jgi:nucleoside-diphosphate-sugar epimerase
MRVAVTGGSGLIGRAVVSHLAAAGHRVLSIDRRRGEHGAHVAAGSVEERRLDLLAPEVSADGVLDELLAGQDALVHLASVTGPYGASPEGVFHSVVGSGLALLAAAGRVGISRAVAAGSINTLGMFFGQSAPELPYLPIDEAIPGYTTDPYSFGKAVLEEVASYAWRMYGISTAVLRFPMTVDYEGPSGADTIRGLREARPAVQRLLDADPAAARREYQERLAQYRRGRAAQLRSLGEARRRGDQVTDPVVHLALNFFSTLHTREAARAVEACLTAEFDGSHACYISDPHNDIDLPSEALASLFYAGIPRAESRHLAGTAGFIRSTRLQRLTGWEPAWTIAERYREIRGG